MNHIELNFPSFTRNNIAIWLIMGSTILAGYFILWTFLFEMGNTFLDYFLFFMGEVATGIIGILGIRMIEGTP